MVPTRFGHRRQLLLHCSTYIHPCINASLYLLHHWSRAGDTPTVEQAQKSPSKRWGFCMNGADCRSRTGDLLITSQLLYQLS